jgi:hypothetical protein
MANVLGSRDMVKCLGCSCRTQYTSQLIAATVAKDGLDQEEEDMRL